MIVGRVQFVLDEIPVWLTPGEWSNYDSRGDLPVELLTSTQLGREAE